MCTAMKSGRCFGRTLDLEYGYAEQVVATPRDFPLPMRHRAALTHHHALLGVATVAEGFPLYYDAVNERGLAMAGLNFPHSAVYAPAQEGDVASFELIPYILGRCATVAEAKAALAEVRVCDTAFSAAFPPTKLHWMVADEAESIVVEAVAEGLRVYRNPIEVMTNESPFPQQVATWSAYAHLTPTEPQVTPPHRGRGSGGVGLPGDYTSPSRLVKAAFIAAHSEAEDDPVGQFFHAMAAVEVPRGCLRLTDGQHVTSRYTSCMDLGETAYYYRTYGCSRIHGVRMVTEGEALVTYDLPKQNEITWEN